MNTSSTRIDLVPPAGYQPGYNLTLPRNRPEYSGDRSLLCDGTTAWHDYLENARNACSSIRLSSHAARQCSPLGHYNRHSRDSRADSRRRTALLRYRVAYGVLWRLLVAYAAAFGQFQQRHHALQNALAPPWRSPPHWFRCSSFQIALLLSELASRYLRTPPARSVTCTSVCACCGCPAERCFTMSIRRRCSSISLAPR